MTAPHDVWDRVWFFGVLVCAGCALAVAAVMAAWFVIDFFASL